MNVTRLMVVNSTQFNGLLTALRYIYGLVPIALGADKFFYFIVDWNKYVSPWVAAYVPLSVPQIVMVVGVVEIIAGFIVLSKWTRLGAYLVATWLMVIVINLLTIGGMLDIALRDIVIAVGYIAYGMLTQIKEGARSV